MSAMACASSAGPGSSNSSTRCSRWTRRFGWSTCTAWRGIGKSTLLREIARRGAAAGWTPRTIEGRDSRRRVPRSGRRSPDRGRAAPADPVRYLRAHLGTRRAAAPGDPARAERRCPRRLRQPSAARCRLGPGRLGERDAVAGPRPARGRGRARAAQRTRGSGGRTEGAGAQRRRQPPGARAPGRRPGAEPGEPRASPRPRSGCSSAA